MSITVASAVFESFDGVANYTQLVNMGEWITQNNAGALSLDASGFTGQALKVTSTGVVKRLLTTTVISGFRVGFRIKFASVSGAFNEFIFNLQTDGGPIMTFFRTGTALSWSTQDTGTAAVTPNFLVANTWYYIELRFILGDPGVTEIRVNRVIASSTTPRTNHFVGITTTREFRFGSSSNNASTNFMVDDFYMVQDSDGYQGECRIQAKVPNGNGNYSQGVGSDGNSTDNYQLVDEQSTNDADYVEFTNDGEKDTYAHAGVTAYAGHTVIAEQHVLRAAYVGSVKKMRSVRRLSGTDATGADITLTNTLRGWRTIYTTNPSGGALSFVGTDATEYGPEQRP